MTVHYYEIREHEVPLFPVRYVKHIFGITTAGLKFKERRGQLPAVNFKGMRKERLYSIEDLAVIEYIYKEVWPYKQGVKVPDWTKELAFDALAKSKQLVVEYGKARDAEDWRDIDLKHKQFNRYRLQLYIESWRRRLLDVEKFFPELVNDEI